MFEVEQKFHLRDAGELRARLRDLGGQQISEEQQTDTYFNHPDRDFGETREALRIRCVDGAPMLTYKGPKLPGKVKAREEMEWRLDPGDPDGEKTKQLWRALGFREVGTVRKHRQTYQPARLELHQTPILVTIDHVTELGQFAEVEMVVASPEKVDQARLQILKFSESIGLEETESRSYLTMLLELSP